MNTITRRQNINDWNSFGLFNPFEKLALEINHLFGAPVWEEVGQHHINSPRADIFADGNDLIVRASLPGIAPEEINVNIEDNTLTIDAEHKEEKPEQDKPQRTHFRRERIRQGFHGSITLPDRVRADSVTAESKNGILTIRLPKVEAEKPKRICVTCR